MAKTPSTIVAAEHKIEEFADDLGKMLGHARTKAEGWIGQRATIVKNLTQLRDEATALLRQLGHEAETMVHRGRKPGRPAGSKNIVRVGRPVIANPVNTHGIIIVGGKKTRTMSAKARAAISKAQKARWAKVKAGKK